MSKKAIWIIIGLMSAAVIGVVWLQTDLIGTSMRVNEEKFDKNVYESLKKVAERLEDEERKEAFNYYSNGYVTTYLRSNRLVSPNNKIELSIIEQSISKGNLRKPKTLHQRLFDQLFDELVNNYDCFNCPPNRSNEFNAFLTSKSKIPLDERIRPDRLNSLLQQELADNGITTDFEYGVKQCIIINAKLYMHA